MEGVFGISSMGDCLENLYQGTCCLQQRGQEYCGLSTFDGKEIKIRTHRGLVAPTFEDDLLGLEGYLGIGHTSSQDRQPVSRHSRHGNFTIGFNGYIANTQDLRDELFGKGHSFATLEHVELLAALIAEGETIGAGIERTLKKIQGPCSLVLLCQEGVYVARDLLGRRPLVLGNNKDSWVVASETSGFDDINTEIERVRDVEPGEVLLLRKEGITSIKGLGSGKSQYCSFEWIYYARPDSVIEGISVTDVRHNLGRFLAQNDDIAVDAVGPVPFSGILHAEGYHLGSDLPSVEVFLLPQYIKRTYIMPLLARKIEKRRKLKPLRRNIEGKRIILVDDSIRSGITMRDLVFLLKTAGAREVHIRIASPPSIRYCPYEKPPLEEEDFIASRMTVEEIGEFIGADTLMFQGLENVPKAIGLPPSSLCLECFL